MPGWRRWATAAPVKTLTELRDWNMAHRRRARSSTARRNLDVSDEMDLERDRARYEADRAKDICGSAARTASTRSMKTHKLDALLFPGASGAGIAAKPGYPTVIVPFATGAERADAAVPGGFDAKPAPFGVSFTGMACSEPRLIALAYAFEQATKRRVPPGQRAI